MQGWRNGLRLKITEKNFFYLIGIEVEGGGRVRSENVDRPFFGLSVNAVGVMFHSVTGTVSAGKNKILKVSKKQSHSRAMRFKL